MSSWIEKELPNGQQILVLKNEYLEVWFTNMGATILRIVMRDQNGCFTDVAMGYASLSDYPKYRDYMGATVGRTANRIRNGQFTLGGTDYQLPVNNGPNCNHGGTDGFSFRMFIAELREDSIVFILHSPDGEEGYPGNMDVKVTYRLQGGDLIIHYEAESDQDTLASFTNHTYFNLSGHPTYIGDHLLQIHADFFGEVDENTLFTGRFFDTAHSPMDFREPALIRQALESGDSRIDIAHGMDHTFLLKQNGLRSPSAIVHCPATGIELRVLTTMPQIQIYTANWFDGTQPGKYNEPLQKQCAICLETQNAPDDIHLHADASSTILKKGEKLDETTVFSFRIR